MTQHPILEWIYATPLAAFVRENDIAFPWIESVHVIAITLVVGSIAIVDLRLLGLASRERTVSSVISDILPVTWSSFGVAAATGLLLFSSNALQYSLNSYFVSKMALLALAAANMLVFHRLAARDIAVWATLPRPPNAARMAGGGSLLIWALTVAAGRWIGFTMPGS
jgi:hypothetical protein